ncbi:P-loop containing nucleoside triphosphate hydrolase protein [Ilyonectria destructans]|nr:P-loop containing nucleoside triphosphate hydrolase protein [Ilyonectria destructans]
MDKQFNYVDRPGGELVLQGISLSIQQGAKVGICGRTGSGKSSFMLALLRLVEIEHGDILINALSLADMAHDVVRRRITVIPQDPLLLTGTIRFSVDPWREHSDETIALALHEVGLWDVIFARGGMGVEMDACPLSRGQQQLFCLARALLSKSQVLILDEATSNLDEATQAKIMEVIRKSFAPRTVLVVAHHLHTIRAFDQIIVLDGGRLVESGTPDGLLGRPGKLFAALEASNRREDAWSVIA